MNRGLRRTTLLALLALGTVAISACGGSSNNSSAYNNRSAAYSGSSSTSSNSSTTDTSTAAADTGSGGGLPASTPITDPRLHAGFVKGAEAGGATPTQAAADADCIVKGLPALGVNNAGDLASQKGSAPVKALSASCAKQAGA